MWRRALVCCLAVACGDPAAPKEPITIGLIAPKSGVLEAIGLSFERVAVVAVAELNKKGGANGHPLQLVVLDDATDDVTAREALIELIEVHGAVAVIGPATSGAVTLAYPVAAANHVPIISPSSTAPGLADADDGGYMFRNVPNDSFQGLAIAYYLRQRSSPPVDRVVVVQEDTPYGNGLAGAFAEAFTASGGTVDETIKFTQSIADDGSAVFAKILAASPTMVVLIALEKDGKKIANRWAGSGELSELEWFFTDGARSSGFLDGLDAKLIGSLGTAPTFPSTGDAFEILVDRYNTFNDDDISSQVFATNVWDAVFQIGAGLAKQEHDHPGEPFGGEHLRDALLTIARGPGQIFHAGQWRDLMASIASGGDVDYDGASGPCDFLDNGETIGPYEVWQIQGGDDGQAFFSQQLFLEARAIEGLLAGD